MNEQHIHDLAVAFATVKLKEYQIEQRKKCNCEFFSESDDDEIKYYAKMYKSIIDRFEMEYDSLD